MTLARTKKKKASDDHLHSIELLLKPQFTSPPRGAPVIAARSSDANKLVGIKQYERCALQIRDERSALKALGPVPINRLIPHKNKQWTMNGCGFVKTIQSEFETDATTRFHNESESYWFALAKRLFSLPIIPLLKKTQEVIDRSQSGTHD